MDSSVLLRKRIKMKTCQRCGDLMLTDDFYKNRFNPDGLDKYCKFCRQEYNSDWVTECPAKRYIHQWRYRNRDFRNGNNVKSDRLHDIWASMLYRCANKKNKRYGGRGISVCDAWKDFSSFEKWTLANGYRSGLSIDRIDNDGNYCPENCQWITRKENYEKALAVRYGD